MDKKLLLFDLDDTLLTREKEVTPRTIKTIKDCGEKGMLIGYITGRAKAPKNQIFFTEKYNLPNDFIAHYNGAEIYVGDLLIESNIIPYENAMKMIHSLIKNYPNAKIGVYNEPWSYSSKSGENWNNETGEKIKCTIFDLPDYDVQRIRIEFDKNDTKENLNELMTEDTIYFVTSDGTAMILNKNATKEHALTKASEHFNIPLSNIIAFGDDINDAAMLKTAGIGVAMGNAIQSVKNIADFVTDTNENDGIAKWIEEHIF